LEARVRSRGWKILSSRLAVVQQPAVVMARLHAMNMCTWGRDRLVQGSFDLDEVARVQAGLDRIASGEQPAHPVSNALRELVAVAE
ncbi:MAG: hypothetical protein ACLQIJ_07800, partial [Polyangia bacterium]